MKHKQEKHLFDYDVEAHHRYEELLKESRIWNNMGQYWLGKQCSLLADRLLQGDESAKSLIVKTENHYF